MCGFVLRKLNCQNVLLKLLLDVLDFYYSSLIAYLVFRLDCTIWWFNKMLSVTMDNIGKFFPPRVVAKEILQYFTSTFTNRNMIEIFHKSKYRGPPVRFGFVVFRFNTLSVFKAFRCPLSVMVLDQQRPLSFFFF